MSLRDFHLLFIGVAAVFAVYFAVWAFGQWQTNGAAYALLGTASVAAGAGLVAYAIRFRRRSRYW